MMTKRRDIIKIIATAAVAQGVTFTVTREGSRHNEIGNRMAEVIYKEAAAKLGKDWWKK